MNFQTYSTVFRVKVAMSFGYYFDGIIEALTMEDAIARAVEYAKQVHPDSKFWLADRAERIESGVIISKDK